jgi:hypothetical protein
MTIFQTLKQALCISSNAKLSLNLLPSLLALKLLSQSLDLFAHTLLALFALPLLIHGPTFHDSGYNLGGVDVLEFVVRNLAVDVEGLGNSVGVVCEGHELGDAVVDSGRGGVGEGEEEGFGKREWGAEHNGMNVLSRVRRHRGECEESLLCIAKRTDHARRRS